MAGLLELAAALHLVLKGSLYVKVSPRPSSPLRVTEHYWVIEPVLEAVIVIVEI